MNYFNLPRKFFWCEELVLLPQRWKPPEDEPLHFWGAGSRAQYGKKAQLLDSFL